MKNDIRNLFVKNIKKLPNYGGDVETLLLDCKICHGRRCTLKSSEVRKCLSVDDIKKGFSLFVGHRKTNVNEPIGMYSSN